MQGGRGQCLSRLHGNWASIDRGRLLAIAAKGIEQRCNADCSAARHRNGYAPRRQPSFCNGIINITIVTEWERVTLATIVAEPLLLA